MEKLLWRPPSSLLWADLLIQGSPRATLGARLCTLCAALRSLRHRDGMAGFACDMAGYLLVVRWLGRAQALDALLVQRLAERCRGQASIFTTALEACFAGKLAARQALDGMPSLSRSLRTLVRLRSVRADTSLRLQSVASMASWVAVLLRTAAERQLDEGVALRLLGTLSLALAATQAHGPSNELMQDTAISVVAAQLLGPLGAVPPTTSFSSAPPPDGLQLGRALAARLCSRASHPR